MGKWQASRALFNMSWGILRDQKKLVMFPIYSFAISITITVLVGLLILVPEIGTGFLSDFSELARIEEIGEETFIYAGIIVSVLSQIITMYFNAAVIRSTNEYLSGNLINNKKSLSSLENKTLSIINWATINAIVGIILQQISRRSKLLGKIIVSIMGATWNITTYFMLPILVIEDQNITESGKKSVKLIRKTWGEAFLTNMGVELVMTGFALLSIIPLSLALISGNISITITVGILLFTYIVAISIIGSVLNTIIKVLLYRYATEMKLPESIDTNTIHSIFTK